MDAVKVIPLVCPSCGSDLHGMDFHRLYYCETCRLAREPGSDATPTPVEFAANVVPLSGKLIFLPFWYFDVKVDLSSVEHKKQRELAVAPQIERVWVTAFSTRNSIYFGDPGLAYTLGQVAWKPRDDGFIAGAAVGGECAGGIAKYFVLSAIDKRVDVTGVDMEIQCSNSRIVGVPFSDQGDRLTDGLLGKDYPQQVLSDINAIRESFKGRILRPSNLSDQ